jgi:hypothetical protein
MTSGAESEMQSAHPLTRRDAAAARKMKVPRDSWSLDARPMMRSVFVS